MATERRQMMNGKVKPPAKPAVASTGSARAAQAVVTKPTAKPGMIKPGMAKSEVAKSEVAKSGVMASATTAAKPSLAKPSHDKTPAKAPAAKAALAKVGANGKAMAKPQAQSDTASSAIAASAHAGQAAATAPKSGGAKSPLAPKSILPTTKPSPPTTKSVQNAPAASHKSAPLTKPAHALPPSKPAPAEKLSPMSAQKPPAAAKPAAALPTKAQAPAGSKPAPVATKPSTQTVTKSASPGSSGSATLAPRVEITAPIVETVRPPRVRQAGDYALEEQVGFQLRRAHQRATTIFNDIMAQFDVTPTQFAALAKIDDEGPVSQNHLGRLTSMDPSTILGVVGRLVRQGYVQLRSTPGDARLTLIELTPDGQRKIVEMKTLAAQVTRKTLKPLSPAEAKTLTDLLSRIG